MKKVIEEMLNINISSMFMGLELNNKSRETIKRIFFVRKPIAPIIKQHRSNTDLEDRKAQKRIEYISEEVLKQILASFKREEGVFEYDMSKDIILGGKYAVSRAEMEGIPEKFVRIFEKGSFINNHTTPSIIVQRESGGSEDIFFREFLQINRITIDGFELKPFMYFNLRGTIDKKLETVFNLLCDEGIGGERSTGCGWFEGIEIAEHDGLKENGEFYITLSAVYPHENDMDKLLSYMLEDRRGYVFSAGGTSIRKPYYRLLAEGSIFKGGKVKGLVDTYENPALGHPVYIYGKPFLVGFGGN